jgi:hypothetical protein
MFTKDEPAAPAAAAPPPSVPPPPPNPAAADGPPPPFPEPPKAEGPPSSRGWTVFMEPGNAAAAAAAASSAPPAPASPPTPATPPATAATPVAPPGAPDPEAPVPGGPRRGWTMFMETPIAEAQPQSFGPATPTSPTGEADASADGRGWTVFGAPSPMPAADSSAPIAVPNAATVPTPAPSDRTVVGPHIPAPPPGSDIPDLPSPDPTPRGKTIIAPGMQSTSGAVGEVTGRTGGVAPMPDTQYFRRGDIPPERPAQRTTEVDPPRPPMRPPGELGDPLALAHDASLATRSSGLRTVLLVLVGLAVVGGVVTAVLYLT